MRRPVPCRNSLIGTAAFASATPLLRRRLPRLSQASRFVMSLSGTSKIGISRLNFSSTFTEQLPPDVRSDGETRQVLNAAFSLINPTNPQVDDLASAWKDALEKNQVRSGERGEPELEKALIAWSPSCAQLFDLDGNYPDPEETKSIVEVLGGFGALWSGMKPYAMCYGGHQFGSWAGQLGDGRAISLGEYVNKKGDRWEIQLKGAGKTPYSRFADGRAVLRSSIREFLCSEAMYHLGVPTTRALSLVGTGAGVIRDMFYTGSPQLEPGATVARIAPSFIRLGNFQLAAFRGDVELLKGLANYSIKHHFPDLLKLPVDKNSEGGRYTEFVREVARRNAEMVAQWQGVGFVHGVMNTDNFSILGQTIDYGPYGFLDAYDPEYTPNTTDIPGRRYKFSAQPSVAHWNILMFAKCMTPLCGDAQMQNVVREFDDMYDTAYYGVMSRKLGLSRMNAPDDKQFIAEFLDLMTEAKADYTNTWRALAEVSADSPDDDLSRWYQQVIAAEERISEEKWMSWLRKYRTMIAADSHSASDERTVRMNKSNPKYILRNYMAQVAIEKAEKGDYSEVRKLHDLLLKPYEVQEGMGMYTAKPPTWASKAGVCVNSCSS